MSVKLIALDMDGTTLNEQHKLSEANRHAIEQALQKEIVVTVCTGRSNTELDPVLALFPQLQYFINGNGCKIYDQKNKQTIWSNPVIPSTAKAIYENIKDYPGFIEVYTNDRIYTSKYCYEHAEKYIPAKFIQLIYDTRTPFANLDTIFTTKWKKPIYKINIFDSNLSRLKKLYHKCQPLPIQMTSSVGTLLEFNSPTSTKANGLAKLAAKLGIKPGEVMAIGDGDNDISMLEYAGYSVAMANAVEEAKKAAKYQTLSNDENGVAAAINKFALC